MSPQLSYSRTQAVAFAGMKVDLTDDYVRSYANTEASAEMPFGVMLALGTGEQDAILPASGTAKLIGVLLHSHDYGDRDVGTTGVLPKGALSVLSRGTVWVTVEEAVAVGDRPFIRFATGAGGSQKGAWRKSADTATALELKGGRYVTAASANGLAQVEFDALVQRSTL